MPSATLKLQHVNGIITHCEPKINYPNIDAILRQQSANMVQKRLNLIYQQCGQAHNSAFFHAQGYRASIMQQQAQNQALALEKIQELGWQLWRIHQHFFGLQLVNHKSVMISKTQAQDNALLSQCRTQLMSFKSQMATDCWHDNSQAKPIAIDWPIEQLTLWDKHIYRPLRNALTTQAWASLLCTPQLILTQFESGPSVRQGQQNPNLIDRIDALWLELQQARLELNTPTAYAPTQRKDGTVDAVRGALRHHITWQQDKVEQYQIEVPTVGIIHSFSRSVIGLNLSTIGKDLSILSLWVLSHFPCMEVSLELSEAQSNCTTKAHTPLNKVAHSSSHCNKKFSGK
ncbi:hypothetical protein VHA01S_024_00050 [Vibrio halioticoli NBRC 102217]|uniref:Uncharacterized protein n=1 Tax=Vibrio halioticoli NBRC 102217 TaxID=1219072 RepID=V5FIF6_9VIBR|nr:hypothetical protein [Vibrio halioticoli]GAD89611.1 hypothetical protein VHA01S_024_00050 [Vibrio halioticoli NBRC 102217]